MASAPVLLVHGFASSYELNWVRNGWPDLLADSGRSVISLDLLGHGTAPKPHEPDAYADLPGAVIAAAQGHAPVDAVGFSLGGVTLLHAAARRPELFGRLVIGGVGEGNLRETDAEPVAQAIVAGLDALGHDDGDNRLGRAFAQFAANGSNDPLALAACLRRPGGRLTTDTLELVRSAVLLVCGDRDFQMPVQPIADSLRASSGVSVRVLKGVDHFGTPQSFGFIDAALEFLAAG